MLKITKTIIKNLRQIHRKETDAAISWVKCKANISFCIIFIRKRRFKKKSRIGKSIETESIRLVQN